MVIDEGPMKPGSAVPNSAEVEMTTLRRDLQKETERLEGANDNAITVDIVPALQAIRAILDNFHNRLRALEDRKGVDGGP